MKIIFNKIKTSLAIGTQKYLKIKMKNTFTYDDENNNLLISSDNYILQDNAKINLLTKGDK